MQEMQEGKIYYCTGNPIEVLCTRASHFGAVYQAGTFYFKDAKPLSENFPNQGTVRLFEDREHANAYANKLIKIEDDGGTVYKPGIYKVKLSPECNVDLKFSEKKLELVGPSDYWHKLFKDCTATIRFAEVDVNSLTVESGWVVYPGHGKNNYKKETELDLEHYQPSSCCVML